MKRLLDYGPHKSPLYGDLTPNVLSTRSCILYFASLSYCSWSSSTLTTLFSCVSSRIRPLGNLFCVINVWVLLIIYIKHGRAFCWWIFWTLHLSPYYRLLLYLFSNLLCLTNLTINVCTSIATNLSIKLQPAFITLSNDTGPVRDFLDSQYIGTIVPRGKSFQVMSHDNRRLGDHAGLKIWNSWFLCIINWIQMNPAYYLINLIN